MRYFLTGATGFVGSRLARQLVEAGHQVVALVRRPQKAAELAALGVELHPGDITDRGSLRGPMAGVDGAFHVAGWYKLGQRDPSEAEQINVVGTRNVLEVMLELGVPKGVYTSTLAVNSDTRGRLVDESYRYDGPHLTVYDQTKWTAHRQVAEPLIARGLPLVIVQPGLVYGPGDPSLLGESIRLYLQRRLPAVSQGAVFCWAHVEDAARAHRLAMEKGRPGETYIIAGPPHSTAKFFEIAAEITGVPAPRLRLSPGVQRAAAGLMGLVEKVFPVPPTYSAEYLRSSAGVTYLGDNAKARRELGYDPRPLRDGLPETLRQEMQSLGMR
jgi:nucleoside-diphosphate-sugar epimerase